MKKIEHAIFHCPGISLKTRDAVKLRGYIGNLFKERSPLLHNHLEDGSLRYRYPLVQYKVVDKQPFIVGFEEGAGLLRELFVEIKELVIDGIIYPVSEKFIGSDTRYIGVDDQLHSYNFVTNWMALNEVNFKRFKNAAHSLERHEMLNKVLAGNILSMFKAFGYFEEKKVLIYTDVRGDHSNFKENKMLTFRGSFMANLYLPPLCGVGKAVSRGFGTIIEKGTPIVSYS
ncbi:MAG: hypothetical protein LC102_08135 [Ignavibacteriales bacterium]|jgi:hypothetical protein|nr:MAG: DNA repair protein [Ignavibacteriaceae bacterium]MBW7873863.1 CRISPR-associated endonuclease Cas6 [Ignavibacteria bacterium]MCZ2143378.1 hypothetical protein [Ignavibacteriales bacterium]OQY79639.1 MAG: hypothetical protein B6D45_00470 [Ignavibacteriales bacterium UTCHB3]MBV6444258.1 hypothetical protein [Ignavibacteriaceae bacterium]